eukprot:EG_transcript_7203
MPKSDPGHPADEESPREGAARVAPVPSVLSQLPSRTVEPAWDQLRLLLSPGVRWFLYGFVCVPFTITVAAVGAQLCVHADFHPGDGHIRGWADLFWLSGHSLAAAWGNGNGDGNNGKWGWWGGWDGVAVHDGKALYGLFVHLLVDLLIFELPAYFLRRGKPYWALHCGWISALVLFLATVLGTMFCFEGFPTLIVYSLMYLCFAGVYIMIAVTPWLEAHLVGCQSSKVGPQSHVKEAYRQDQP